MIELIDGSGNQELDRIFGILESKIAQAAKKIDDLKNENQHLNEMLLEANNRIAQTERELEAATEKLAEAEQWKAQVQDLTRVKNIVAGKIENLLHQIDNLPLLDQ